jgi:hypothetical protein
MLSNLSFNGDFATSLSTPQTFLSGDTISAFLRFTPHQARTYLDSLRIYSNAPENTTTVRLNDVGRTSSPAEDIPATLPGNITVSEAFPNPFNSNTQILLGLSKPTHVRAVVFDELGRPVTCLTDETKAAGTHRFVFSGKSVPSDLYFCRIMAGDKNTMQRILLIK